MKRNLAVALFSTVFLSACGGNYYTGPSGELTTTNAAIIKSTLQGATAASFGKPSEVPSPSFRSTDYSACTTETPVTAEQVDANSNGVKKLRTTTYDCKDIAGREEGRASKVNLSGTVKEQDLNDDVPKTTGFAALRFDVDFSGSAVDSSDASKKRTGSSKGYWDFSTKDGKLLYKTNWQGMVKYEGFTGDTRPDRYNGTATFGSSWNFEMTPTSSTDYKTGTIKFGGYWGYELSVALRAETSFKVVVEASGDATYDSSCSMFYKTGQTKFKAGKGELTYDWNCTSVTVKLDGTAI